MQAGHPCHLVPCAHTGPSSQQVMPEERRGLPNRLQSDEVSHSGSRLQDKESQQQTAADSQPWNCLSITCRKARSHLPISAEPHSSWPHTTPHPQHLPLSTGLLFAGNASGNDRLQPDPCSDSRQPCALRHASTLPTRGPWGPPELF